MRHHWIESPWAELERAPEPLVRPARVEVGDVLEKDSLQMTFAKDDDVIAERVNANETAGS